MNKMKFSSSSTSVGIPPRAQSFHQALLTLRSLDSLIKADQKINFLKKIAWGITGVSVGL